jgi:hypothetical protein
MDAWPGDWRERKWINHVEVWQRARRPEDKPPGVSDLAPPAKAGQTKDYQLELDTYLSRPEVHLSVCLSFVVFSADFDPCVCRHWKACS